MDNLTANSLGVHEVSSALGTSPVHLKDAMRDGRLPAPDIVFVPGQFALSRFSEQWLTRAKQSGVLLPRRRPTTIIDMAERVERAMKSANQKIPLFNRL